MYQRSWRSTVSSDSSVDDEEMDEIDRMQDVSRLPKHLQRKLRGLPAARWKNSRLDMKRLYASLGEKSGVDPAIMWPTKEELQEIIEDEREWEPTLEQKWKNLAEKIEADLQARKIQ